MPPRPPDDQKKKSCEDLLRPGGEGRRSSVARLLGSHVVDCSHYGAGVRQFSQVPVVATDLGNDPSQTEVQHLDGAVCISEQVRAGTLAR